MASELQISGLIEESIVDGEGLRFVVFVQGCPHHCPGCHNPETHPRDGGTRMHVDAIAKQICENPLLDGVTFSGGEPFAQAAALAELGALLNPTGLDITTYSGYTHEQLQQMAQQDDGIRALLAITDVLIDGPFIQEQIDLALDFRGSTNQRIIRLHESE